MGLELAYSRARDILGLEHAECLEAAVEVERLRLAWRPDRVRVLVLAESHVWTSPDEVQCRVSQPNGKETGFARFIYCLGFGEPELVDPPISSNRGTPQFWKLFHDTIYGPTVSHATLMKSSEAFWQKRVQNKLDLLERMQREGIWLVDASVSALYRDGVKPSRDNFDALLRTCWESHIGEVANACAPSAILIVGKGVESAIGAAVRHDLGRDTEVIAINQPNASMSAEAIASDRSTCFDLCCRHST